MMGTETVVREALRKVAESGSNFRAPVAQWILDNDDEMIALLVRGVLSDSAVVSVDDKAEALCALLTVLRVAS